jgi:hypothetical protein
MTSTDTSAIARAAASPLIWTLGMVAAKKHFHMRHADLKHAQRIAIAEHPEVVDKALGEVEINRLTNSVVRTEVKFPFIHRKLVEGESAINLAAHFVNVRAGEHHGEPVTRALMYQKKDVFQAWTERRFGGNIQKALAEVESLAASVTPKPVAKKSRKGRKGKK